MNELIYLRPGRQRQQEMVREAERERLAAEARKGRKERADRHWTSDTGRKLRRLGSRLLKGPRSRKNTG